VVEESDAVLVARALDGDDEAFASLMTRHKGWAFQFVRRYIGNQADAYDVLQETFFAAWRALNRYRTDRPFEFWLRRIALNKCRDRQRRDAVRRLIGIPGSAADGGVDPSPDPLVLTQSEQELRELENRVHRLPRALKEPLLLMALEGLSQVQVGRLLGLSPKAVETKVYRARVRLATLSGKKTNR
jgi:RNA polymerase sigma factor (sigma-70 family)